MLKATIFSILTEIPSCRNIPVLSKTHTVYALDMIGYGRSDKPAGFVYTMETWAEVRHTIPSLFEALLSPSVHFRAHRN